MRKIHFPLLLALGIPAATWLAHGRVPALGTIEEEYAGGTSYAPSALPLTARTIGAEPIHPPRITNVSITDLDGDGRNDVLVCDAQANQVICYRRSADGSFEEQVLVEDVVDPAHATVADLDGDGQNEVLVSVLGNVNVDNSVIGKVVLLRRQGDAWTAKVLLEDVRRVADVQAGDLDGDGDVDLAVAVFGYSHGEVLWLENRGGDRFRDHVLLVAPGSIHVPIADYDLDGDLDICVCITQDEEEIWGFENQGGGAFRKRRLFYTPNFDIGGAGLIQDDLDGDGDPDLLFPVGDNYEARFQYPQPYHGCLLFENEGDWQFTPRRISDLGGTYAAAVGDLDGDGDRDVVLVSMENEWARLGAASVVWLENVDLEFRPWQISDRPISLVTVACGDLDGDGRADIVAGGLYVKPPYQKLGRVTGWFSGGAPP